MRKAAVAGAFYAGGAEELRQQIEGCYRHPLGPGTLPGKPEEGARHIIGLVSPHAGYMYSGPVAAHGFLELASETEPGVVVIMGPNHRGMGASIALSQEEEWQTPLGSVRVDREVGGKIISESRWAQWDDLAHRFEHSIEVQLPFLQYIYGGKFRIVPIAMLRQDLDTSQDLGQAIASALKDKKGLIIASTDFTHYEPQSSANRKDRLALEAILNLDPKQLETTVATHNISMCGCGPVMAMLIATKLLGANKARLLRYATSGDVVGDYSAVVGYASVEVAI